MAKKNKNKNKKIKVAKGQLGKIKKQLEKK
jgi:hypothetical protein